MRYDLLCLVLVAAFGFRMPVAVNLADPIFDTKPKTPVDALTYDKIAKYPAYTTAALLLRYIPDCIAPFNSTIVQYINATSTDTRAAIFLNHDDQEIILGIPGTNSTRNEITDLEFLLVPYIANNVSCPGCLVDQGFLAAWNSIADTAAAGLAAQLEQYPQYQVVVAGHSLGGAICGLAYATLNGAKFPVKAAYCSGSPRIGTLLFANYMESISGANDTHPGNYYRTTHSNDGVPGLPPLILGYVHTRTEYWEMAYNASLSTTYRCYGNEPLDCNFSEAGANGIDNAHSTYAGVRYNCRGGYDPGPPNPDGLM